jgi:spermidine synthase
MTSDSDRVQHAHSGWRLKLVVFVSGAVLMGLEITGSRILAAHFGSSIYVWGSVIAVFLTALSGGYYIGGVVADRKPVFVLLNALLLVAGCWLLIIPFYANWLSDVVVTRRLGERLGPLLTSLLLFGGPSVLMGMVSPYAVRLATKSLENLGNVAGRLYALSTMGSIVGTLVTAFWLIPLFGVKTLLQILGLCLVLLSPLVLAGKHRAVGAAVTLIAFLLIGISLKSPAVNPSRKVVLETDSAYHQISVIDDEQQATRRLQFNKFVQTSISLNPPYETRAGYTDSFHLAYIFKKDLKRILMIGGGGGVGARKFITDYPDVTVDLVEIDPKVVEVSLKYFHLEKDPRLNIFVEDGRNFIRTSRRTYDLVILDAFTIGGQIPFQLTTQEFLLEIKNLLTPDGVLLSNMSGSIRGNSSQLVRAEYKTILSMFPHCYAFPRLYGDERQTSFADPERRRSIILVATKSGDAWESGSILNAAQGLQTSGMIKIPTFMDDARQFLAQPFETKDVPLLTDDYAPVDTLGF